MSNVRVGTGIEFGPQVEIEISPNSTPQNQLEMSPVNRPGPRLGLARGREAHLHKSWDWSHGQGARKLIPLLSHSIRSIQRHPGGQITGLPLFSAYQMLVKRARRMKWLI